MAVFNSAVLTTKGNELLIDAAAGNKITFTRMAVGCGEYTDEERERSALERMKGLKDIKQEFTFSSHKKVSEQCCLLTAIISNRGLAKGYKITELGIYGKVSGDTEDFLCSIAVTNSTEESDTFPPYNGLQECQIVQDYYITISPDAEVTVITRGASVLLEDFLSKIEEIKGEFQEKIDALKMSFRAGVDKIYNYLKGLGFTPADRGPDAICASIQNIYDRRYNDGRSKGQADVIADPDRFGISTAPRAIGLNNGGIWRYSCTKAGQYDICVLYDFNNNHGHDSIGNKVLLDIAGNQIAILNHYYVGPDAWNEEYAIGTDTVNHKYITTVNCAVGDVISLDVSQSYFSSDTNAYTSAAIIIS